VFKYLAAVRQTSEIISLLREPDPLPDRSKSCARVALFEKANKLSRILADASSVAQRAIDDLGNLADIERVRKSPVILEIRGADGRPLANQAVAVDQTASDFAFGCCLDGFVFNEEKRSAADEQYLKLFAGLFNFVASENSFKWNGVEHDRGKRRVDIIEREIAWCRGSGLKLNKAHGLVYDDPPWVKELPADERRRLQIEDVNELLGRFGKDLDMCEIVNETADPDFITFWHTVGRKAVPGLVLSLNNYPAVQDPSWADALKRLAKQGVPYDLIGYQAHGAQSFDQAPDRRQPVLEALDRFATVGKPVYVTEYDAPGETAEAQADALRSFYSTCYGHPVVRGIVAWGFWEGDMWLSKAAWVTKEFTFKPAYSAYRDLVFDQWRTRCKGTTDTHGLLFFRGFQGHYQVNVEGRKFDVSVKSDVNNRFTLSLR
jgi:GH35 family endo-1,4-beta-xylanase